MTKKTNKMIFGLAFLLVGGLGITANAQLPKHSMLKADIPFGFVLQDKTFSAGEYTIMRTPAAADSYTTLEITNDIGKRKTIVFETNAEITDAPFESSILIFDKIGNQYFLSKIYVAGLKKGNQVSKSETQKNLEKGNVTTEQFVVRVGHWKVLEKIAKKKKK